MKISIIGDGVFGTFLKKEFSEKVPSFIRNHAEADVVILAIPSNAFQEVALANKDKHIVNVCSVQSSTNETCLSITPNVTGIHPLFGPNTMDARNAIVTLKTSDVSDFVIDCFQKIMQNGTITEMPDGGKEHDEVMAKTHVQVVKLQKIITQIIEETAELNDEVCPNSFLKLREFAKTFSDMPKGTLESIMGNPFITQ